MPRSTATATATTATAAAAATAKGSARSAQASSKRQGASTTASAKASKAYKASEPEAAEEKPTPAVDEEHEEEEVEQEGEQEGEQHSQLHQAIAVIFNDAQNSASGHARLATTLRKIHEACASSDTTVQEASNRRGRKANATKSKRKSLGRLQLGTEEDFNQIFFRFLDLILAETRRSRAVDLAFKFVERYIEYSQDKESRTEKAAATTASTRDNDNDDGGDDDGDDSKDSLVDRFIEALLRHIVPGFTAKEKRVRTRVVYLAACALNAISEITEDLYQQFRKLLTERLVDKEATVRAHTAVMLCRMFGSEDEADGEFDGDDAESVISQLLKHMAHDSAAEVRRIIVLNTPLSHKSLPQIISRAADVSAPVRRAVYRVLAQCSLNAISLADRKRLLNAAVHDTDAVASSDFGKLVTAVWLPECGGDINELLFQLDAQNTADDIAKLLRLLFSVGNTAVPGGLDAISSETWSQLSAESALHARVVLEYHYERSNLATLRPDERNASSDAVEKLLPIPKRTSEILAEYSKALEFYTRADEDDIENEEIDLEQRYTANVFILVQLLKIAALHNFDDEPTRRFIFEAVREMLRKPDIPTDHMEPIIDIFAKVAYNERDFTQMVVELLDDMEQSTKKTSEEGGSGGDDEDDEDDDDDDEEQRENGALILHVKKLLVARYFLEHCRESIDKNPALVGIMTDTVVPTLKFDHPFIRLHAMRCMALLSLLDVNFAAQNCVQFVIQATDKELSTELREVSLMGIIDSALVHGMNAISEKLNLKSSTNQAAALERIFIDLVTDEDETIKAIAVEGAAKLIAAQLITTHLNDILRLLGFIFFSLNPDENQRINLCLGYFFPAIAFSSAASQEMLSSSAVQLLGALANMDSLKKDSSDSESNESGSGIESGADGGDHGPKRKSSAAARKSAAKGKGRSSRATRPSTKSTANADGDSDSDAAATLGIDLPKVAKQLAEWTDPRLLEAATNVAAASNRSRAAQFALSRTTGSHPYHVKLASSALEAAANSFDNQNLQRAYIQLASGCALDSRFLLSAGADSYLELAGVYSGISSIREQAGNLQVKLPLVVNNALSKIEAAANQSLESIMDGSTMLSLSAAEHIRNDGRFALVLEERSTGSA
ncbi:hypothetical protein GQ42DRAFT_70677 [Ramicandelaber brevisporus]|nr:hypothetical protein GQ42DRAFT_70677 [Ramicandelaber brevisporus]